MNAEKYRIEAKMNVNLCGERTSFKIYIYDAQQNAYVYSGGYFALGWNASDERCYRHYESELQR